MRASRAGSLTTRTTIGALAVAVACCAARLLGLAPPDQPPLVTLSIVGTSDLHGAAFARSDLGGLPLLAGYINNLREARASDGGAVLLVDSGDTFQGEVESNLSEGALVVDAYNAIGYTAQAIGNHDFDFGSIDSPAARQLPGDLRGALKARAAQAHHPFLAANLLDAATGRVVEWRNVQRSRLVEAAGIKVGIVGVMTRDALRSTLAANVQGLQVAPLAPAIAAEAATLRRAGARVVVVAAHAGGRCTRFDDPSDLSSCEESEIFQVANSLPHGLVDVIAAGHTHAGLAHLVNGIGIVQPLSRGQAFSRADVVFDRRTGAVARVQVFAPRPVCAQQDATTGECAAAGVPARYEGRTVTPDPAIVRAMAPALQRVHDLQAASLGVTLDAPVRRATEVGSPLGRLFAGALREALPGADVAVVNNAGRGLRADLPDGPLTLGRLYDVFPFDNRIARIAISGGELSRWLAMEIGEGRLSGLGVSGVTVRTSCVAGSVHVDLVRGTGRPVRADEQLVAAKIGAPTLSGGLAAPDFLGGVGPIDNAPIAREAFEDWFRRLGRLAQRQRDEKIHESAGLEPAQPADCVAR